MMKKFFCDDTLGKLMKKLRLLGFDTERWNGNIREDRILLSRSRKRWQNYRGESFLVFSDNWREQLSELDKRYAISKNSRPFTRCVECNAELLQISSEQAKNMVPERVYLTTTKFKICPVCKRVYWSGTHVEKIRREFRRIFNNFFDESDNQNTT